MAHEGIAAVLVGLEPVLVPQGFQLGLHGVEDRVVFVHRFIATVTTLTESEDFRRALPGRGGSWRSAPWLPLLEGASAA